MCMRVNLGMTNTLMAMCMVVKLKMTNAMDAASFNKFIAVCMMLIS